MNKRSRTPRVRKGQPAAKLWLTEFSERFHARRAGNSFADPDYDLSVDWLEARAAIRKAQRNHDRSAHARILLICGAARNDKSCPGEMSKTYRMAKHAQTIFKITGPRSTYSI